MKRILNVLAIFFAIMSLMVTVQCNLDAENINEGGIDTRLIGTWVLTKITSDIGEGNQDFTPDEVDYNVTIIFFADGTFEVTFNEETDNIVDEGTWSVQGSILVLIYDIGIQNVNYTVTANTFTYWTMLDLDLTGNGSSLTYTVLLEYTRQS